MPISNWSWSGSNARYGITLFDKQRQPIMDKLGQVNRSPVSASQSVSTDSVYSIILKRKVATTIILPPNYNTAKSYPVFYLLHWWSGNNESFLKTSLITELKNKQLIVVTPSADTC